ncbi:MAG TPA: DUF3667 domain-containing protein [Chitinophagaceae bacterium]
MIECQNCGSQGDQKFCPNCGQVLEYKRINLPHLVHEVTHTFWHLEKGFLFTLKELAVSPGIMQKKYLSGLRLHYQKPFPLFAISGTIGALCLYLIYKNAANTDQFFYKHYYFLVQATMLPLYALITYLLFKSPQLYYAEALVLNVYMVGFMSIMIIPINVLSFFLPNGVISLIEVIFLLGYNIWTYLNFFSNKAGWWVVVKSIASIIISYLLFNYASRLVMEWFM